MGFSFIPAWASIYHTPPGDWTMYLNLHTTAVFRLRSGLGSALGPNPQSGIWDPVKKNMQATDRVMFAASFHNFGCLQTAGSEPLKEEQFDILNRFAKVFDLTY